MAPETKIKQLEVRLEYLDDKIKDQFCRIFGSSVYMGTDDALDTIFQELEAVHWLKDPANISQGNSLEDSGIFQDLENVRKAIDDMEASYEMRHRADMRAIQMWQQETGRDDMWPDHGDLCLWLMTKIDAQGATASPELK